MLCARGGFQNLSVSLKPLNIRLAVFGGKERILSIGFVASSPARIAENVDVRCPQRQALVNISVAVLLIGVVFCAGFLGSDLPCLLDKLGREHRRKTYCLRKHSRNSRACKSVKTLVPPIVRRYAQPFYCRRVVSQLTCLFIRCHSVGQLFGALLYA